MPPTQPTAAASTMSRKEAGLLPDLTGLAWGSGRDTAIHAPRGVSTAPTTRSKTRAPGSSSTRIIEPMTTPGGLPDMRRRVSRPPVSVNSAGDGHDVVEQIRWRDRGARRAENADLKRQEQDCTRDTRRTRDHGDDECCQQGNDLGPACAQHPGNLPERSGTVSR